MPKSIKDKKPFLEGKCCKKHMSCNKLPYNDKTFKGENFCGSSTKFIMQGKLLWLRTYWFAECKPNAPLLYVF